MKWYDPILCITIYFLVLFWYNSCRKMKTFRYYAILLKINPRTFQGKFVWGKALPRYSAGLSPFCGNKNYDLTLKQDGESDHFIIIHFNIKFMLRICTGWPLYHQSELILITGCFLKKAVRMVSYCSVGLMLMWNFHVLS